MPLLNKKPFEPAPIPQELQDNDRVYYLETSNEIFLSYDDYFQRQIQLTSTIWSCEYTGKSGLTFFEASESERNAMETIGNFPSYLEVPILFVIDRYTCRGRFDELLNDVHNLMKDRYFIGEECYYTESGKRRTAKVLSCSVETKENSEGLPSPSSYRYNLQILDEMGSGDDGVREDVSFESMGRGKQAASRAKLKIFLKNSCYLETRRYAVKGRFLESGVVQNLKWELVLGGPEPNFPQTPVMAKGRPSKVNGTVVEDEENFKTPEKGKGGRRKSEKGRVMSEKKRQRIESQQEELIPLFESAKRFNVDVDNYQQSDRFLSSADISSLKEKIKAARVEEREAHRAMKKQKAKAKTDWGKKRDDLECDDLKPLPEFPRLELPDWMTDEEFADYIMILQFFTAYSDLLPIKEIRGTSRVTLSDIIMGIRCPDPQRSPYADLIRVLLSARTDRADEEDGDEADLRNKEEIQLIQLQNCDPAHGVYGEDIREASQLHENLRLTHGESLRHFPVDWMTLSEILRLLFMTSGYYTGQSTHRHRLFARGYYKGFEDPGFILSHENPDLMEKLATSTVFHLTHQERLQIMDTLIRQLLSYSKYRSAQEEKLNQLFEQKRELRKLRNWDELQEKDARDSRLVQEYEIEKMKEQGVEGTPELPKPSAETKRIRDLLRNYRTSSRTNSKSLDELEELLLAGVSYNELEVEDIVLARDVQRERVKEIAKNLQNAVFDMCTSFGTLHLGRDRAFRNYFIVENLPIVLVENSSARDEIGSCIEATPIGDKDHAPAEEIGRVLGCSGSMETCTVHGAKRDSRPKWSYIDSSETLLKLISACNPRGYREINLSEEVLYHQRRIEEMLTKMRTKRESGQFAALFCHNMNDPTTMPQTIEWDIEMRELLLDLEEKIEQGGMGRLPEGVDRLQWREMLLETGDISSLIKENIVVSGNDEEVVWDVEEKSLLNPAGRLGLAFLMLVKAIPLKYLKKPFVQTRQDENGCPVASAVLQNWQRTVINCESVPAVALYLSTFEPCILWGKSRLQGKCRLCRRKGSAETLTLCGDCDKCFHLDCVHLKEMVSGWICSDCTANRKKIEAAEKRRAAKEEQERLNGNKENTEEGEENNSMMESSMDSIDVEMTKTSSGRSVKKVATYKDPRAPPVKNTKRLSARTNGHHQPTPNSDEDYESEDSVRRPKRRRTGPQETVTPIRGLRENDPQTKERMSKLEGVIRQAMKLDFAWPFLEPVDEKEVPDYYDIIKEPIDLQTMITKIKNIEYESPDDIRADIDLLVANCKHYNEEESDIYKCAEQIEDFFFDRLKPIFDNKKRRR